jgi:hypothetical protein
VSEVVNALIAGVEQRPSPASTTITGGRANARRSLDVLLAPPAPPPPPPQGAAAPTAATVAAVAKLAVSSRISRQRLLDVLRRGLLVLVRSTRDGTATIELFVDSRTARRLGLTARSVRVGRRRARVKAGTTRVRVRLTRRARARLRRARSVRLTVRSTVTSGSDRARASARRVTLRR